MQDSIGQQVKKLRLSKKMTLKALSEQVGLSTSFLSQFERGNCTIAIDSLINIAHAMDVDVYSILSNAVPPDPTADRFVLRSYERKNTQIQNLHEIQTNLSADSKGKELYAREITLLPGEQSEPVKAAPHIGEEFIYVLEGVLTLLLEDRVAHLYPGDTAHFSSNILHTWYNETNKIAKMLIVNYPNPEALAQSAVASK